MTNTATTTTTTTTTATAVIGVVAGYNTSNRTKPEEAASIIAKVWQEEAAKRMEKSEIYISAIIAPAAAVYHTDWGCPVGGEAVATVTATRNPEFVSDDKLWREEFVKVTNSVKERLEQATVTIELKEIEILYLK